MPSERVWSATHKPLFDAHGEVELILQRAINLTELRGANPSDVTAPKLATLERENLIAVLKTTNDNLDRFVYVASHDLKAPLGGIEPTAKFLKEEPGPRATPEVKEILELMRNQVSRMGALIDGVLRYARAGESEPLLEVDTAALVRDALELTSPAPGAAFTVKDGLPWLMTAAVPLQQAFMNLISNALNYSQRPDVHIEVSCRADGAFYVFTAGDDGQGIAAEFHSRIWEMF